MSENNHEPEQQQSHVMDISMTAAPQHEHRYIMVIMGSTEEPLRNVSLMDIAGAVAEALPGFKVAAMDMKSLPKNEWRTCDICNGSGCEVCDHTGKVYGA